MKLKGNEVYPDTFGFEILKRSFEEMGCCCDHVIGKRGDVTVGISMWYDKIKKNPKFWRLLLIINNSPIIY